MTVAWFTACPWAALPVMAMGSEGMVMVVLAFLWAWLHGVSGPVDSYGYGVVVGDHTRCAGVEWSDGLHLWVGGPEQCS